MSTALLTSEDENHVSQDETLVPQDKTLVPHDETGVARKTRGGNLALNGTVSTVDKFTNECIYWTMYHWQLL